MSDHQKVNILLVDDQPAKLLSLETILESLGENIIQAGSADEALKQLLAQDVAVVLVDVCMPRMDGFELAELIRSHPRFKRTAIIFISAVHLTDEDRVKGYQLGAVDYIPVPIVPEVLRAKVSLFADLYRKTDELQKLNRELENRVAQRTADLEASTARLRESEHRFRLMADSAPTLIWLSDVDKRCFWFNKPWLEFTGRSMEEEMGDGWADGVHPEDLERCLRIYTESFDARQEFRTEYRVRRHDGAYRWLLNHGLPLYNGSGEFTGYIGSCVDMTDQVLARQSMERHQTRLEQAVAARTAELAQSNERLRLSERMATIGTLAAGLGHDMGNLLLPVRMRLDAIEAAGIPDAVREDVGAIREAAQYLQRLAGSLRLLALDPRNETAQDATDLASWWRDVEGMIHNGVARPTLLLADLPESLPPVRIGKAALTQIIFNLVQNASDALRGRDDGRISVSARPSLSGSSVTLLIEDNGAGMDEETKKRCLEPFFTTKTRGMSTGLGLALVSGLLKRAAGSVQIESQPGRGTAFRLEIPFADRASLSGPVPRQRGRAVISVKDPRVSAHVRSVLDLLAFEVHNADEPVNADLWITDGQGDGVLDAVNRFVGADPLNRAVVVATPSGPGPAVSPATAAGWGRLVKPVDSAVVFVEPELKPSAFRARLMSLLAAEKHHEAV